MKRPYFYGGQAVIEGVMMRGRNHMAVAVRHPSGSIVVHSEPLTSSFANKPYAKWPLIRGVATLWDTLSLGMRALLYSANVQMAETPEAGAESEIPKGALAGIAGTALVFGVAVFFLLPLLLVGWIDRFLESSFVSNLIEGGIRLALILGYMIGIGFLPDIRRVFAYHGAEHKAINAYEAGVPLEVGRVQRFSTAHTRCGTSFLLVLVVASIFVFALLGQPPMWLRAISRVVLLPFIAAVAYEIIRFGASYNRFPPVRVLFTPNLALQRLTTRPPDDSMVEVSIAALKRVLHLDGVLPAAEPPARPLAAPVDA
ncbi:MAG: DUF1385 domain-containing protein [Chloroflexi bacterium]|nr:DUF1385 domain-containing protein [Chloroflexota bacterium]